jgi:cyclic pyranopterin phosphate synthase
MSDLTHLDDRQQAQMVAVSAKPETHRVAIASSRVRMSAEAFAAVRDASGPKGDALQTARLAAFQGVKRTADLIPLCHPLRLSAIAVDAQLDESCHTVTFDVRVEALERTGVEMEALTGASVAALTLYDMIKAVDRSAVIDEVRVRFKRGGRRGDFGSP